MRLYLDACCFNRPFDDLSQIRIRLEAEAVEWIREESRSGHPNRKNTEFHDSDKLCALASLRENTLPHVEESLAQSCRDAKCE